MARCSIRSVSRSPRHFKWATTRMRLRASLHCVFSTLMCFLNEMCESHHSPRNFVDSSTGRSVFPTLTVGGLWVRDRGAVKCMTLHLWAANLKPFLVAHSCMAFTACCKCLYGVQSKTCHSQDTTSWNTLRSTMWRAEVGTGKQLDIKKKKTAARSIIAMKIPNCCQTQAVFEIENNIRVIHANPRYFLVIKNCVRKNND